MCVAPNDHCCGCHVRVGVEVLGWVGVIFNCLALVGAMIQRSPTSILSAIIGILIYAGLIVAKRTGRPMWYLPFLVVNVINLTLEVIALITLPILLSKNSNSNADAKMIQIILQYSSGSIAQVQAASDLMAVIIVMLILMIAWSSYTQHVVSRAYRCLKLENMPVAICKS